MKEKLTKEKLTQLVFKKKGSIWTRWILDLREDEEDIFSFDVGRIYEDIETIEHLQALWKVIGAEKGSPLFQR